LLECVENFIKEKKTAISEVSDIMKQRQYIDFNEKIYTDKTRAEIKIQDGCDRFCSYCIIPYARGPVRSRKIDSIIEEAEFIANKGIKEIVITGIHIASYGKDFGKLQLIDLLEELNKIEGIERIRLGSLEPTIITNEFINRLKNLTKVCDHFHLSLQSGCNETLKRMNRKYTIEQFKKCVEILRANYKNVAITTDVIAGFPGETEEEFNNTYAFLKEIKFSKMHIFKYSRKKGTKAAIMPNQIEPTLQENRSSKLIELSNHNEYEFARSQIGKNVSVLFEELDKEGYIKGHTSNYLVVKIKGNLEDLQNKIIDIKIESINSNNELIGKL